MASFWEGLVPLAFSHSSGMPSLSESVRLLPFHTFHVEGLPNGRMSSVEIITPSLPSDWHSSIM